MAALGMFGGSAPRIRRLQPMQLDPLQYAPELDQAQIMLPQRPAQRAAINSTDPAPAPSVPPMGMWSSSAPKVNQRPMNDGGMFRALGYRPDETGQSFPEWLFSDRQDVANAKNEIATKVAMQQAREAQQAQIDTLRRSGVSDAQIIAFMNNPEKWSESYATNLEGRNIVAGDSALVNGTLMTAPKFGVDGGFGYTQTPDGITWGDQRGMSYGEKTDAGTLDETGRHNRATEAISRETNDIARKKAETDAALATIPNFGNENQLRTQYLGQAKTFETVKDAYTRIQAVGNARNPAEQMSLIFGYMKMLDPGSTVREGEYATAQNTTGLPGWITNAYNKAKDGVFLNDQQVKDFLAQSRAQYDTASKNYVSVLDQYRNLADRYKMDPTIIQDFRLPGAGATPREQAKSNAAAARGVGLENAPGAWPLDAFRGLQQPALQAPSPQAARAPMAAPASPASAVSAGIQKGMIDTDDETGQRYRFKGGDPKDQRNWELVR